MLLGTETWVLRSFLLITYPQKTFPDQKCVVFVCHVSWQNLAISYGLYEVGGRENYVFMVFKQTFFGDPEGLYNTYIIIKACSDISLHLELYKGVTYLYSVDILIFISMVGWNYQ